MQYVGEDVARSLGNMARQLVESHFGHRDADSESSGHSEDEIDDPDSDVDDSIVNLDRKFDDQPPN